MTPVGCAHSRHAWDLQEDDSGDHKKHLLPGTAPLKSMGRRRGRWQRNRGAQDPCSRRHPEGPGSRAVLGGAGRGPGETRLSRQLLGRGGRHHLGTTQTCRAAGPSPAEVATHSRPCRHSGVSFLSWSPLPLASSGGVSVGVGSGSGFLLAAAASEAAPASQDSRFYPRGQPTPPRPCSLPLQPQHSAPFPVPGAGAAGTPSLSPAQQAGWLSKAEG